MKKTRAFVVSSTDLFNRKKNPKGSWSVAETMQNPAIEKRCPECGGPLFVAVVQEKRGGMSWEDESLYCPACKEEKNVPAKAD